MVRKESVDVNEGVPFSQFSSKACCGVPEQPIRAGASDEHNKPVASTAERMCYRLATQETYLMRNTPDAFRRSGPSIIAGPDNASATQMGADKGETVSPIQPHEGREMAGVHGDELERLSRARVVSVFCTTKKGTAVVAGVTGQVSGNDTAVLPAEWLE